VIQPRTFASDMVHSEEVSVFPLDINIIYRRRVPASRDSPEHGMLSRVDERIDMSVPGVDGRSLSNSYLLSQETGDLVYDSTEPLMEGLVNTPMDDVLPLLFHSYMAFAVGQMKSAAASGGIPRVAAKTIRGVDGIVRKINLSRLTECNDLEGNPFTLTTFEDMVVPALQLSVPQISLVRHDKLYVIDRSFLVDCGDSSLLEEIADRRKGAGVSRRDEMSFSALRDSKGVLEALPVGSAVSASSGSSGSPDSMDSAWALREACTECYNAHRDRMWVYLHNNAVVRLIDRVFPKSGLVYVYTDVPGIVDQICDFYGFKRESKVNTRFGESWLSLEDRGLEMSFIGGVGESEYQRRRVQWEEGHDTGRNVTRMLDEFDFDLDED